MPFSNQIQVQYCLQKQRFWRFGLTSATNNNKTTLSCQRVVLTLKCVTPFLCLSRWEATGSVIGPRGFYLTALTGHVSAFPFISKWPHWPFRAHYQYLKKLFQSSRKGFLLSFFFVINETPFFHWSKFAKLFPCTSQREQTLAPLPSFEWILNNLAFNINNRGYSPHFCLYCF